VVPDIDIALVVYKAPCCLCLDPFLGSALMEESMCRNYHTICRGLKQLLLVGILSLAMSSVCTAQEATARIIGTVTDPQGAVIPDAAVTVTNAATKVTYPTVTLKDGAYQIFSLPIGTYDVTVEKAGFKKAISSQHILEINQVQRIDIKMEVGNVSESVEISAGTSTVETVNSTIGESITARPLQDLPLNGRNALNLALLLPGVTPNNSDDTSAGFFNIAGGRSDSVTFLLDGGLNNDLLDNGIVYNPNPDALAEFRILKSDYGAEYGRNAGGIVSEVIKSGTNQIHGTVYEFLRNTDFDANQFFNNLNGEPRDVLNRSQFGFTLGGPFFIPKVFNGKDRAFWFVSYEGQRQTSQQAEQTPTFTPAEMKGDFSGTDSADKTDIIEFLKANPFFQPDASQAAKGIIAPDRINPIAENYIKAGLIPTSPTGNLRSIGSLTNNYDALTTKEDFNITNNDRLSITGAFERNPVSNAFGQFFDDDVLGYPNTGNTHTYYLKIGYTKTFSATLLNDLNFNTARLNSLQAVPAATLPTASQLGMNIPSDAATGPPLLFFLSGLTTGFSGQGPSNLISNTFAWSDTLTWIKGRNTFKFGGYISPYQQNMVFDFFTNGDFSFDGPFGIGSGNPVPFGTATRTCQTCDLADFLFGLPDNYFQAARAPSNIRSTATYGFAQDELKVTSRLTVTLGLRYEYSTPKTDTQGRTFVFIPGFQSQRFVNAPPGLAYPGDPGAPTGVNFADKNNFAPRFGFAWDPTGDGKTSIRGGFGVYYDILKGEDNFQYNGAFPFESESTLFFNPFQTVTGNVGILANPFLAAGQTTPFPSKTPTPNISFANELPFGNGGVFVDDPHLRTPYIYQYSLSIQREFLKSFLAEADYIGSSSHKLTSLIDANPYIPGTQIGAFDGLVRGTNFGFISEFQNVSHSNYNGLGLSLTKNLSDTKIGNTYFILAYTWAHSMDNASGFRNRNAQVPAYDTNLFYASSDFDARQRISFSGGWDLPFARLWESGPKRLLDGWTLAPIFSWNTGYPLDVFAGLPQTITGSGVSGVGDDELVRANLTTGSIAIMNPRNPGNLYFNPADFNVNYPALNSNNFLTNPASATYGTLPRNAFRGPSNYNLDLALIKNTNLLGERLKVQFRVEAFDIFNHAEFANPDLNPNDPNFGQIQQTVANDPYRIVQLAMRFQF
jgi:hypothetical protein